jgi:hypothetical protein
MGHCSSNCPTHKGGVYLFPPTHKIETKINKKLETPKTILKKPKEGENKTSKKK